LKRTGCFFSGWRSSGCFLLLYNIFGYRPGLSQKAFINQIFRVFVILNEVKNPAFQDQQ
jgi:hypothetical protein